MLKEIAYTVNVVEVIPPPEERKPAYLKIDSIDALVVVQDEVEGKKDPNTGNAMVSVQQRFSIKFEKVGDPSKIVAGQSGNPGYIDGLPLLLGKKDTSGAVAVSPDGFRVRGGDLQGKCINAATGDMSEMGDPLLKFNVDLSYGCALEYTLAELEAKCKETTPLADLEIFKNMETVDSFGQFGSAYAYYPKVSPLLLILTLFFFRCV